MNFHPAAIVAAIIVLIFDAGSSKAQLFGPATFEDCARKAALEARTEVAVGVMLRLCSEQFPSRWNEEHQTFELKRYEFGIANSIDTKSAKPTQDEYKMLKNNIVFKISNNNIDIAFSKSDGKASYKLKNEEFWTTSRLLSHVDSGVIIVWDGYDWFQVPGCLFSRSSNIKISCTY